MSDPGRKPSVPYWHLWVDTNGVSHQRQCHLTNYYLRGVGPADPQWNNKQGRYPSTVIFTSSQSAGSAIGTKIRHRNGLSCYRADGGLRVWMGLASSRGLANSPSARTRAAKKSTVKRVTALGQSATNPQFS